MNARIGPLAPQAAPAAPAHDARADKLRHAAGEFETLLVKQLLKEAKLLGDDKANAYGDMAIDAVATGVERGGGLGLARRIEDALSAGGTGKGGH